MTVGGWPLTRKTHIGDDHPLAAGCFGDPQPVQRQQRDERVLSRLAKPGGDAQLRHAACFDAAVPLIPRPAPWTDPDRFEPITDVMTGGNLANTYRGQLGEDGRAAIPGVFFAGDAVCTTTPAPTALPGRACRIVPGQRLIAGLRKIDRWRKCEPGG